MGSSAKLSTSNAVQVWRGSTQLTSGAAYIGGETLTVKLQTPYSEFVFQISGATFSGSGLGCSSTRSIATTASMTMPATSTPGSSVSVFAGYASGQGTVSITNPFTLVGGPAAPTYPPTKAPTAARTVVVFPVKLQLTNLAAATFNAASGAPGTLATAVKQVLASLLGATDATAVDVNTKGISVATVGITSSVTPAMLHLQTVSSCLLSFNVSVIREFTPYTTTTTLVAALTTAVQSTTNLLTILTALKTADAGTFGSATGLTLAVSAAPVVNTLQTAAPSSASVASLPAGDAAATGGDSEEGSHSDKVIMNGGVIA